MNYSWGLLSESQIKYSCRLPNKLQIMLVNRIPVGIRDKGPDPRREWVGTGGLLCIRTHILNYKLCLKKKLHVIPVEGIPIDARHMTCSSCLLNELNEL